MKPLLRYRTARNMMYRNHREYDQPPKSSEYEHLRSWLRGETGVESLKEWLDIMNAWVRHTQSVNQVPCEPEFAYRIKMNSSPLGWCYSLSNLGILPKGITPFFWPLISNVFRMSITGNAVNHYCFSNVDSWRMLLSASKVWGHLETESAFTDCLQNAAS